MWRQVIYRALREAEGSFVYAGDPVSIKYNARKWLSHPTKGFYRVCELAGLSEEQVGILKKRGVEKYGRK